MDGPLVRAVPLRAGGRERLPEEPRDPAVARAGAREARAGLEDGRVAILQIYAMGPTRLSIPTRHTGGWCPSAWCHRVGQLTNERANVAFAETGPPAMNPSVPSTTAAGVNSIFSPAAALVAASSKIHHGSR
jgi:hypothetical protein